ncbi:hypothetical protein N7486_000149 [Penicillium sp. IBT 16267x]|nr:hypothetical protein N7486_000149 [Penicillium sp. IBT 16267x]
MHFSIFVALIGLVGTAVAAPQPEADSEMRRRADEAQGNAQTAQNGQKGQWWGPGYGWGWGHPGWGWGGRWGHGYGGGYGGGWDGWHH